VVCRDCRDLGLNGNRQKVVQMSEVKKFIEEGGSTCPPSRQARRLSGLGELEKFYKHNKTCGRDL